MNLALETMIDELADHAAGDRAYRSRRQQGRGKQADCDTDPTAPAGSLATEMVTGLADRHVAFRVVGDEDRALDLDRSVHDECNHVIEIVRRFADVLVSGDQYIRRCVRHGLGPPCCGSRSYEVGRSAPGEAGIVHIR